MKAWQWETYLELNTPKSRDSLRLRRRFPENVLSLARGDHPNFCKNAPRMHGQMKFFHVGSHQFRESLRELLRELWFSHCTSREMPFREWNFAFRELLTTPRKNRAIVSAPILTSRAISLRSEIASERWFSLRLKCAKLIPTARIPARCVSPLWKIASKWRCATLAHSDVQGTQRTRGLRNFDRGLRGWILSDRSWIEIFDRVLLCTSGGPRK